MSIEEIIKMKNIAPDELMGQLGSSIGINFAMKINKRDKVPANEAERVRFQSRRDLERRK